MKAHTTLKFIIHSNSAVDMALFMIYVTVLLLLFSFNQHKTTEKSFYCKGSVSLFKFAFVMNQQSSYKYQVNCQVALIVLIIIVFYNLGPLMNCLESSII